MSWMIWYAEMYQQIKTNSVKIESVFYLVSVEHFCLGLQINVEEEKLGEEERLVCAEVQIESSSVAAVCGLHHAVLGRIQVQTYSPRCQM